MQALDKIPAETLALLIVRSVYEATDGGPGGTEVSGVSDVQIGTPPGGWSCTAVIEAEGQKETLIVTYDGKQYSDVVQGAGADEGDRSDAVTPDELVLRAVRVLYGGFENWEVKGVRNLQQGTPAGGLTVEVVILNTDDRKVLRLEGVWDGEEWRDTILSEDTDSDRADAAKKGKGRAKPNCKKGRPCGGSCISRDKQCRIQPTEVVKDALNRASKTGGGSESGKINAADATGSDFFQAEIAQLRGIRQKSVGERLTIGAEVNKKIEQYVEAKREGAKASFVQIHGMKYGEMMTPVPFDGLMIHDSPANQVRSIRALIEAPGVGTPEMERLNSFTKNIFLAGSSNEMDNFWAKEYKTPGFKSVATGGDGNIVVYSNKGLGAETYIHEAGHNMAKGIYGKPTPPPISDFGKISTPSPTPYGRNSRSEDFAESVMLYFDNNYGGNNSYSIDSTREDVIERILRDPSYGG